MFKVETYYDFANNGTKFTDSLDRVWVKQAQYGQAFLIGLTRDTPSFTAEQLAGLAIDGFRVLPLVDMETGEDAQEKHQNKRGIASRFLRRSRH